MVEQPKYRDGRQNLWRETFACALSFEEYLATGPEKHRVKWELMAPRIAQTNELAERVGQFTRQMNVLCYSGIWCGDCVRQGPMLLRIAEASVRIDLRFVERVNGSPLAEELRINGAMKVPVVVFLSEEYYEIGRVGDRMLSAYRRKAENELGPACDVGLLPPPERELAVELAEWVDTFERMQWIVRLSPMLRARHND